MQIINVNVKENIVDVENANVLTSGSANIVKCIFNLDANWEGYTITAIFTTTNKAYRTVLEENMCLIPYEVLQEKGKVQIGVYGTKMKNDVLLERYTTTLAEIVITERKLYRSDRSRCTERRRLGTLYSRSKSVTRRS